MSFDLKNPWVIGGGVLVGALLIIGRTGGGAVNSSAALTANSLSTAAATDQALGAASVAANVQNNNTAAEVQKVAISARAGLASEQMTNVYTLADTSIKTAAALKAQQVDGAQQVAMATAVANGQNNITFGNALADMLHQAQGSTSSVLASMTQTNGQVQMMIYT